MSQTDRPVALITGARKGIGRYLAETIVARGYRVVGCSRQISDLDLEGYSHICADVADERQVKDLMAHIGRDFGRLDVLVNNVGVASMNHCLLMPVESVDRILSTNVRGTFLVSREGARIMRTRRYGRIVNLTSVAVPMALEGESVYAASKGAIESLTRVMARELAPFGITVNAVGPSPIETDLIKGVPRERIDALVSRLAIKRLGRPEDVFNVVEFLMRRESDYVTGQIIYLGGA
jgi:3-oxoacyl-[acyl-carrier protein] reductase